MPLRPTSGIRVAGKLVVGVVLLVAAQGCSSDEDPDNGGPAMWALASEPLFRIGEQDGPAEYLFDQVNAVHLTRDADVVVADEGSGTVRVYDARR